MKLKFSLIPLLVLTLMLCTVAFLGATNVANTGNVENCSYQQSPDMQNIQMNEPLFLVLDAATAAQVTGVYDVFWELVPIPMPDGTYLLPQDVLWNEHYRLAWPYLEGLPAIPWPEIPEDE